MAREQIIEKVQILQL